MYFLFEISFVTHGYGWAFVCVSVCALYVVCCVNGIVVKLLIEIDRAKSRFKWENNKTIVYWYAIRHNKRHENPLLLATEQYNDRFMCYRRMLKWVEFPLCHTPSTTAETHETPHRPSPSPVRFHHTEASTTRVKIQCKRDKKLLPCSHKASDTHTQLVIGRMKCTSLSR